MPKKYIHKRSCQKLYTGMDVREAVERVKTGLMSYRQASEHYNVPYGVVYRNANGKLKRSDGKQGRQCVLPTEIENKLETIILARSELGDPMDKKELFDVVQRYILDNNIKCNFKNGRPSHGWYLRFMRDHPGLSSRIKKSATCRENNIGEALGTAASGLNVLLESDTDSVEVIANISEDMGPSSAEAESTNNSYISIPKPFSHEKRRSIVYTDMDVTKAVKCVKTGQMSYRQASEHYNIPYGVVYRNANGKLKRRDGKQGRQCVLPAETENKLEAIILARDVLGEPMDKKELFDLVQRHIQDNNIKCNFKNGRPSHGWYHRFMRDHPGLSSRIKKSTCRKNKVDETYETAANDLNLLLESDTDSVELGAKNEENIGNSNVESERNISCNSSVDKTYSHEIRPSTRTVKVSKTDISTTVAELQQK